MPEKTVTIVIDEAGESSIDLEGFQGKGCGDVAKAFQGSDKVIRSEKKCEFRVETTCIVNQVRNA